MRETTPIYRQYVWHIFAGVLLGSAFLHAALWFLVLPGVAVLCAAISKTTTPRRAFFAGFLGGTIKYLLVLSWFWTTYPLDWMLIGPIASYPVIGMYWLLSSVALGLGFALGVVLIWFAMKHVSGWLLMLLVPVVLVMSELLGSLIFSIQTYGQSGSGISAFFSYGYIGYALEEHGILRYLGMFGGVYTLTCVGASIGAAVYIYNMRNEARGMFVASLVSLSVVAFTTGYIDIGPYIPSKHIEVRIALVDTSFPISESSGVVYEKRNHDDLMEAVQRGFSYGATHVVLPEEAGLTQYQSKEQIFAAFEAAELRRGMLVDSFQAHDGDGGNILRAFMYDLETKSVYTYDKQYLVPQGEYVPYMYRALFWLFGQGDFFAYRTMNTALHSGTVTRDSTTPATVPGVMFCSESIMPTMVSHLIGEHAVPFIVHPISHSWFHSPQALQVQSKQMVALQALSNSTYIFQAGNLAPTMVFDAQGRVIEPTSTEHFERTSVVFYDLP